MVSEIIMQCFKQRGEAQDVERVTFLYSINVSVEKNCKQADKINWGHFGEDMTHSSKRIHKEECWNVLILNFTINGGGGGGSMP